MPGGRVVVVQHDGGVVRPAQRDGLALQRDGGPGQGALDHDQLGRGAAAAPAALGRRTAGRGLALRGPPGRAGRGRRRGGTAAPAGGPGVHPGSEEVAADHLDRDDHEQPQHGQEAQPHDREGQF